MSNNSSGALTAIGASYPYSKEELNEKMDDLTELINSDADPSDWREVTPDEWTDFHPEIHVNRFVPEYKSFGEAAQDGLRRMRKRHGIEKPISVKRFAVTKPKDDQPAKPAPQEAVQAEVKPESEPETMPEMTDTPEVDSGSSAEDATISDEPEAIDDEPVLSEPEAEPEEVEAEEPESELEPPEGLSRRDRAEWIMRKLFQKEGSIPNTKVLAKATGSSFVTLHKWFHPWWEWPERFGVDWSSEIQRIKAKAAKEKAAAEEAAKAAAAAAANNIDEEVEEIEPIEEELPVEDIVDDKPEEPDDEESEGSDEKSEDDEESEGSDAKSEDDEGPEGSDEGSEDDEESEESEEEQDFNEATHYTVPPGFSGEISFKFENKSDEELEIWLYFSKFLEVELNVEMSGKRVFSTTSDDD